MLNGIQLGHVSVVTTDNHPHSVDFWAERLADKIISVSDKAPPEIRDQAIAYKNHVRRIVELYMLEALGSYRAHVAHVLQINGHEDMADIVRKI